MNQETIDTVISLQNNRVELIGHLLQIDRLLKGKLDLELMMHSNNPRGMNSINLMLRAEFLEDGDFSLFLECYRDAVQHAIIKIEKTLSEL